MPTLITDPDLEHALIRQRRALGHDGFDEVWDGVCVIAPPKTTQHQHTLGSLHTVLHIAVMYTGRGQTYLPVNITDREDDWKQNYRVPDCCVFLNGSKAEDRETHWFGGPDFCVEVESPGERVVDKLPFYASVGTREVLLVLRSPQRLRLVRLGDAAFEGAVDSTNENPVWLESSVVPLAFRMTGKPKARTIEVRRADEPGEWTIPLE